MTPTLVAAKAIHEMMPAREFPNLTSQFEITIREAVAPLLSDKAIVDWIQRDPQHNLVRAAQTWMRPGVISVRDAVCAAMSETNP